MSNTPLETPALDLERITPIQLRLEAARRLGCEVNALDPETGFLNEIRRGSIRRVLVGGLSPLNDAVAARLVADKHYTGLALAHRGLQVPHTVRCLEPDFFDGDAYASHTGMGHALGLARSQGYPLVVKPNSGSRGRNIAVVENDTELEQAILAIWKREYLALVQIPVPGFDLRIDFLDGEFLFGYTRRSVRVSGDGQRTLRQLLATLDPRMRGELFEERLTDDPIWCRRADDRPGFGLEMVLGEGETLDFETPILNLNRLCRAERIESLPRAWRDFGVEIGRVLSLRHFGVDLKIRSLDQDPAEAVVIEVNSSPSLVHMARIGHHAAALEAEHKIVSAILRDERDRRDSDSSRVATSDHSNTQ